MEDIMKLSHLISNLCCIKTSGDLNIEVRGIAYDSRAVSTGFVFVCVSGYNVDGHGFIDDAVKNGAVAVVVEKEVKVPEGVSKVLVPNTRKALAEISSAYFGHPSRQIKLIGVTGTNGKTTTTYFIKSILEKAGQKVALLGTISNIIGDKIVEAKRTTPESYDLQEMFHEMINEAVDYCVMEVSSHSLELERVAGCTFNVGIFTNLTRDHLDFHKTFENYFNSKLKMFSQSKVAAVNVDDQYGREIVKRINIPVIGYSEKSSGDVTAENVVITSKVSTFTMKYKDQRVDISLPLPGRFNVYNALAAASACIAEGIPFQHIKEGLESVKGIPGRSEVIDSGRGFTIIIDYAHTADGLENILKTVREYAEARIITVFGCGGDRDKTKRPLMGEVSGNLSDFSIVTSDNPRTEDPEAIIEDIIPGVERSKGKYKVIVDRRSAIKEALSMAEDRDVVVIAGKGHENYQVLKDRTIHFDEREIVNEILKEEM